VNAFSLWQPDRRADHERGRACRDVPEERVQPAPVLREMRRASDEQSSADRPCGCLRGDDSPRSLSPPGVHVNYAETVLPMRDGLPKLKDFPAEFGGSGAVMAE